MFVYFVKLNSSYFFVLSMSDISYGQSIELPTDKIFRNFTCAKWFALDIGKGNVLYVYDMLPVTIM